MQMTFGARPEVEKFLHAAETNSNLALATADPAMKRKYREAMLANSLAACDTEERVYVDIGPENRTTCAVVRAKVGTLPTEDATQVYLQEAELIKP